MVFFFFTTGKSTVGYPQEEVQKMQTAHLGNFRRLYEAGILKLAGPCADPEKKKRGIVLLNLPTTKGLEKHFEADPYVQEGIMRIEAFPVNVPVMETGKPADTGISQHSIAIFEAPNADAKADTKIAEEAKRWYTGLPKEQAPAIVIAARETGPIRLVLFFRTDKTEDVKAIVEAAPPIKSGIWKVAVFPQWLAKGVLSETDGAKK